MCLLVRCSCQTRVPLVVVDSLSLRYWTDYGLGCRTWGAMAILWSDCRDGLIVYWTDGKGVQLNIWDGGGICKTRLSGTFPTIGEQKVDYREGVMQKLLVWCRKVVEVVVHDLLQPLRVPCRVGFTLEMPKWINRCHTLGSSLETAIENKIDCKICLE